MRDNKDKMNQIAYNIIQNYNKDIDRDYEKELEEWLLRNPKDEEHSINTIQEVENDKLDTIKDNNTEKVLDIRKKLIKYRKEKSREKNIPAYYIFNNDEVDKLLVLMPKRKQELANAKILTEVKLKFHGEEIINIINSK